MVTWKGFEQQVPYKAAREQAENMCQRINGWTEEEGRGEAKEKTTIIQ
jgi:hypothetical protein